MKALFEKFRHDEEFYNDEYLDFYEGPEGQERSYFDHSFDQFINKLSSITLVSEGVVVWRAVNASDIALIDLKEVGASWSYKKESAHSWYGGEGDAFLIEGILDVSQIDIETTLRQNIVNPDEDEFRLEEQCKILISKIYDSEGKVVKEFKTPLESSSGRLGVFGDRKS